MPLTENTKMLLRKLVHEIDIEIDIELITERTGLSFSDVLDAQTAGLVVVTYSGDMSLAQLTRDGERAACQLLRSEGVNPDRRVPDPALCPHLAPSRGPQRQGELGAFCTRCGREVPCPHPPEARILSAPVGRGRDLGPTFCGWCSPRELRKPQQAAWR
jgi:hypothetical protein